MLRVRSPPEPLNHALSYMKLNKQLRILACVLDLFSQFTRQTLGVKQTKVTKLSNHVAINFARAVIFANFLFFCIFRELILLGINFCDFREVAFN